MFTSTALDHKRIFTTMKKFIFIILLLIPVWAFADTPPSPSFQAGKDYLILPHNNSTETAKSKGTIKIIEFFNYGCPACFNLEPYLEKWLAHKPKNIIFERIPVIFESDWSIYAKTYLTLVQLKREDKITPVIFKAIHTDNMDLSSVDAMADFLNSAEISKTQFLNIYHSPDIDLAIARNKKITNDFLIFQIPGIVIDGKYKVDPSLSGGNYPRLLETVDYLINLEKQAKTKN
jgi:thiol:disulfide interchange protein DsbA